MNQSMEIDPIDDGPVISSTTMLLNPTSTSMTKPPSVVKDDWNPNNLTGTTTNSTTTVVLSPMETQQYLHQLRSEDVTLRIPAAYRWDAIAMTLGPERTRTVCR